MKNHINKENERYVGTVKLFFKQKRFGFITNSSKEDIFVHVSSIIEGDSKGLEKGQIVEYTLQIIEGRKQAKDVKVLHHNTTVSHSTEDKEYWLKAGEKREITFIKQIVPLLKRKIIIHPKKKIDPTYIDFLDLDRNLEADLKAQSTPFFKAFQYGYNPQYTVTFNRKDYEYYRYKYPNSIIYWWINWKQLEYEDRNKNKYHLQPLFGIWEVHFSQLKKAIENSEVPLHSYQRRVNDPINAKESYLFDLNTFKKIM
jgi:cold shock CspA family protein